MKDEVAEFKFVTVDTPDGVRDKELVYKIERKIILSKKFYTIMEDKERELEEETKKAEEEEKKKARE